MVGRGAKAAPRTSRYHGEAVRPRLNFPDEAKPG
jgi:hypothetical protein